MRRLTSLAQFTQLAGSHLGSSSWRPLPQSQLDLFAEATGDRQWIHTDPERAAAGPFGSTVAHGYLLLSLLPAQCAEIFSVDGVSLMVNTGVRDLSFTSAVPVDAEVRLAADLAEAVPGRAGVVTVELAVQLEVRGRDRPAYTARIGMLLRPARRPAAAARTR